MSLKRIKKPELKNLTFEEIKKYISNSGGKPGDPIPTEKEFSERMGISRTVVREALKGLESLGIIEARHGVGRFIRSFDFEPMVRNLPYTVETNIQNSKEIFELRICLETWFLVRDIHKYQEEDLRKIDAALYSFEKVLLESRSKKTIIQAHTAFHCSLFEITGNKQLINLVNLFSSMAMNITVLHKASISDRKHFVAYHRNIVAAIRARDPDRLERRVREHFSEGIDWIESLSE